MWGCFALGEKNQKEGDRPQGGHSDLRYLSRVRGDERAMDRKPLITPKSSELREGAEGLDKTTLICRGTDKRRPRSQP